MEKLGIEQSLAVLTAAAKLSNVIDASLEDDKISAMEWAKIGFAGFMFAKGVAKVKELKAEYLDYDDTEKLELVSQFAAEFDIRNDEAEHMIEQIIEGLLMFSTMLVKK